MLVGRIMLIFSWTPLEYDTVLQVLHLWTIVVTTSSNSCPLHHLRALNIAFHDASDGEFNAHSLTRLLMLVGRIMLIFSWTLLEYDTVLQVLLAWTIIVTTSPNKLSTPSFGGRWAYGMS